MKLLPYWINRYVDDTTPIYPSLQPPIVLKESFNHILALGAKCSNTTYTYFIHIA